MVRAVDGTLYTGVATDVDRRLGEHETGNRGARYLRGRGPLELAYRCRVGERGLALKVEHRLKGLTRTEKEELLGAEPGRVELLERLGLSAG